MIHNQSMFKFQVVKDKFRVELWLPEGYRNSCTVRVLSMKEGLTNAVIHSNNYESLDVARECYFAILHSLNVVVS